MQPTFIVDSRSSFFLQLVPDSLELCRVIALASDEGLADIVLEVCRSATQKEELFDSRGGLVDFIALVGFRAWRLWVDLLRC